MPLHKYRAIPTEIDGILFASKREARRYGELKLLVAAREITDLVLQPRYDLVVPNVDGGLDKICTYVADFEYTMLGIRITEDVKGVKTPLYKLKKKLLKSLHGISVLET